MYLSASEKIEVIRKRKKISKTNLAAMMDISRQNISNKFSRNNLQEDDIIKFANALDCDVEIIFIDRKTGQKII